MKKRTLGIDMGNFNVKTNTKVIFKSSYEEFDYKHEINNDDVIMYGDRKYVIGKGDFDNTKVKSQKKNPVPLFLNAIYLSLKGASYADVNVVVGLPLSQHQNKEIVEEIKELYSGMFEFKYTENDLTRDILYNVNKVSVFPECFGAFYSLDEDMDGRDVLLIDIGGGTVNIALFTDGEYVDSTTLQFGTIDILRTISEAACKGKKGATFGTDDMVKYLKRGMIKWDGKIDHMTYVDGILSDYAEEIMNEIKGKFPLYKSYDIMLSGGGVELLSGKLSEHITFEIIKDSIFSNAIGFYNVGVGADEQE